MCNIFHPTLWSLAPHLLLRRVSPFSGDLVLPPPYSRSLFFCPTTGLVATRVSPIKLNMAARFSLFSLLLFSLTAESAPFKIVLDAGHGGRDSGAVHQAIKESEISLAVCKELETLIKESAGYSVVLTRKNDSYKNLAARALDANRFRGDLFKCSFERFS